MVVATVAEGLLRQAPIVIKYYYRLFSCCCSPMDRYDEPGFITLIMCMQYRRQLCKILDFLFRRSPKKANPSQTLCQLLLGIKDETDISLSCRNDLQICWAGACSIGQKSSQISDDHGAVTTLAADILPCSRPMTAMSGALESSRQALSIRRIFSLIRALFTNRFN